MKDYNRSELEDGRPEKNAGDCIEFCLKQLYADRKHFITDEVVSGLTFEELIGALLLAKDEVAA